MTDATAEAAPRSRADEAPPPPGGCRLCGAALERPILDLGVQPLSESYVPAEAYWEAEPTWPLRLYRCAACGMVQLPALVGAEAIYRHYAYFSSYSDTWVEHGRRLVETVADRFGLDGDSLLVEVASNDGYLLQHAVAAGIPCLGIDPAENVAAAAAERGVPTEVAFLDGGTARRLVERGARADVLIGINVIGHVPDVDGFVRAMRTLLADDGVLVLEIPHLVETVEGNQFDQIYQEHYQYWTFLALERTLADRGLAVFDVEALPTHGGSMRIFARRAEAAGDVAESVAAWRERERAGGYDGPEPWIAWEERARETRRRLLELLFDARRQGRRVAAYGAPGKGNTLLNYCGIGPDLIAFAADRNPFKQGKYLPGSRIPIRAPEAIREERPDVIVILPWNLADEILDQLTYAEEWGATFVIPIPEPRTVG